MGFEGYDWNNTGIKEGEDIERGFFGNAGKKFKGELVYAPYREAMERVKATQPDRLPHFTQRLVSRITEQFPALEGRIQFYTAVGTAFDVYHGVDAFFTLQDHVVTLDVTSNSLKKSAKADIVVTTGYDEDGGIDFSEQQIDRLAKQAGQEFAKKIKSKIN